MADVAPASSSSSSGPHLPHLLKWIKHRASKKENRYAGKRDKNTSGLNDKCENTLYNKASVVSRSSDSIDRIHISASLNPQAKLNSTCTEFNALQKAQLKSESMVALSTHMDSEISDVICKHGSVQRTCRACMQLPPLPPGHERVLRDLQRQEKKRIRSSMQMNENMNREQNPNSFRDSQTAVIRVQSPFHNSSSPEHVYEEIPINFFRGGHVNVQECSNAPEMRQNASGYPQQRHTDNMQRSSQSHHPRSPVGECRPNSRQVSLGNLDFEMAKECDGFLVVPLRDKTGNSAGQPGHWQEQCSNMPKLSTHDDAPTVPCHHDDVTVLPKPAQTTPLRISHSASDSGYQDQTVTETTQPVIDQECDPSTRTRDGGVQNEGQGYSHCKRCRRPHGLYHGVSLCHSDVEDLRQELQYLDIAGLDKHKLRGTTAQSSPSLLHNVTHRRSAFSKYIPKRKHSARSSSNSSYSRVPLGAECSGNKDLAILTTDSYKRQSMSAESDYFSSNYNTSQSDTTSRGSRDYNITHTDSTLCRSRANYVSTSDKSNDTFSEYDMSPETQKSTHVSRAMDSTQQEYEYYLAKARHHNMLKNNVKRIIRSSESERSDAEKSAIGDGAFMHEDTISLTSVTSLSELSTLPLEEATMDRLSCRVHRHVKHPRTSKHHQRDANQNETKTPSPVEGLKPQTRTRKPIRKKRKTSKMEYYKLPNFSGANLSSKQSRDRNSDTLSVSSQGSTKRDVTRLEPEVPEEHKLSSPSSEKLSCRVTDFKLSDIKRSSSKCTELRANNAPPSCDAEQSRSSVYSNHGQINRNSNNRLLSDLMRMNHDRQLFSLL